MRIEQDMENSWFISKSKNHLKNFVDDSCCYCFNIVKFFQIENKKL